MAKGGKRTIIVQDLVELHKGTDKNGRDYTIWQVRATDPGGNSLDDYNLRSFQQLPKHQPIEVYVEKAESARYGVSYTVSTDRSGNKLGAEIKRLNERVKKLEDEIEKLKSANNGSANTGNGAGGPSGGPPDTTEQTPPPMPAGGANPQDNIPW